MGRPFAEEDSAPSEVMPWERGEVRTVDVQLELEVLGGLCVAPAKLASVALRPVYFADPLLRELFVGIERLVEAGERQLMPTVILRAVGRKKDDPILDVPWAKTWGELIGRIHHEGGYALERNARDLAALWEKREALAIVSYSNGAGPSADIAAMWQGLRALQAGAVRSVGFQLQRFGEWLQGGTKPDYLVKGMLQRGYLYALTGQTGHGKTAVALRLSLAVAQGGRFGRHQCKPGRVVYLAGENPDDLRFRCQAVAAVEDLRADGLFIVEGTYSIVEVMPTASHAVEAIGGADLVIVDTSPAFFFGEAGMGENPENNNAVMGEHAKTLRKLTRLPGLPTVLALCHPVKDAAEDNLNPRGASSFKNELDGNLTLWKHDETMVRLSQNKIRGVEFAPIEFELEVLKVDACTDADGEVMPQVSAVFADDQLQSERERERERLENVVVLGVGDGKDGATIAREAGWYGPDAEPERWRVTRITKRLASVDGGKLVAKERNSWVLTPKGREVYDKLRAEADARQAEGRRYPDD